MTPARRPRLRLCYPGDHALAPSTDLATALGHIEAALPGDATVEARGVPTPVPGA